MMSRAVLSVSERFQAEIRCWRLISLARNLDASTAATFL